MSLLLIQLLFGYTNYLPQNDRLNLIFVNQVGKNLARKGRKMAICESQILKAFIYKSEKRENEKNVSYIVFFGPINIRYFI
jgi:hypothetical protein